jgi:hypothetical protein
MGFTSKKMPNNILKNVCKKSFQVIKPFCCEFALYYFQEIFIYLLNDPEKVLAKNFFSIEERLQF